MSSAPRTTIRSPSDAPATIMTRSAPNGRARPGRGSRGRGAIGRECANRTRLELLGLDVSPNNSFAAVSTDDGISVDDDAHGGLALPGGNGYRLTNADQFRRITDREVH